jgi:chemotaxis protein CheZ
MTYETRLALARDLVAALEQGDEATADGLLDEIAGLRETQLFRDVGRLTRQLHDTMSNFTVDPRIASLTVNEIPDAKERLRYVISMTEQAANQTLNAVESMLPISDDLNDQVSTLSEKWGRFLDREMPYDEFKSMSQEIALHFKEAKVSLDQVKTGLNDILMAQGFQDITGQVIRRVIDLVQELESGMVEVIKISGAKHSPARNKVEPELPGPVVPGVDDKKNDVVNDQDDVDDLLSSLGF